LARLLTLVPAMAACQDVAVCLDVAGCLDAVVVRPRVRIQAISTPSCALAIQNNSQQYCSSVSLCQPVSHSASKSVGRRCSPGPTLSPAGQKAAHSRRERRARRPRIPAAREGVGGGGPQPSAREARGRARERERAWERAGRLPQRAPVQQRTRVQQRN